MFPDQLLNRARLLIADAEERHLRIVTAESCAGGLLAALLTDISGVSAVFERGFITYSNRAKEEILGIPGDMIADFGAVSEAVARAMAEGALDESRANLSIAITGIAGPKGGTPLKPVGTVHIASARENHAMVHRICQFGDIGRDNIRLQSVEAALELLQVQIGS